MLKMVHIKKKLKKMLICFQLSCFLLNYYYYYYFWWGEVQLLYNVVLVSAVQQSESAV